MTALDRVPLHEHRMFQSHRVSIVANKICYRIEVSKLVMTTTLVGKTKLVSTRLYLILPRSQCKSTSRVVLVDIVSWHLFLILPHHAK